MTCQSWCEAGGRVEIPEKNPVENYLTEWEVDVTGFSNYLTNIMLTHAFETGETWVSFHTGFAENGFPGTEFSGSGYTRTQTVMTKKSDREWVNSNLILTPQALAQWDGLFSVCLYDQQTNGNFLVYGNLTAGLVVQADRRAAIPAGRLRVRFP